jgi:hypothetical protein
MKIQAVQRGKAARAAMAERSNEQPASKKAAPKPKAPPKDKTAAGATAEQKKRPSKKAMPDKAENTSDNGAPKPKAQQKGKTAGPSAGAVPGLVEELTAEEEKQREEAAVKIQAVHRGKAARAAMAEGSTGQPASKKAGSTRKASKGYAAATATSEQKRKSSKKVLPAFSARIVWFGMGGSTTNWNQCLHHSQREKLLQLPIILP